MKKGKLDKAAGKSNLSFFSTLRFHACLCHIEESFACDCLHADQINNVASDNL